MILVDTSVWVDHLRSGVPELADALERGEVRTHAFVLGELACGQLRNRREVLALLDRLPRVASSSDEEARALIEGRSLMGRGIGWVDVHLLASVLLAPGTRLWTRDGRLGAVAAELGVGEPG